MIVFIAATKRSPSVCGAVHVWDVRNFHFGHVTRIAAEDAKSQPYRWNIAVKAASRRKTATSTAKPPGVEGERSGDVRAFEVVTVDGVDV